MTSSGVRPEPGQLGMQAPWACASPSRATHSATVAKVTRWPACRPEWTADGQVGLAGAGRSQEDHVLLAVDEVEGAEVGIGVALERSLVVESLARRSSLFSRSSSRS